MLASFWTTLTYPCQQKKSVKKQFGALYPRYYDRSLFERSFEKELTARNSRSCKTLSQAYRPTGRPGIPGQPAAASSLNFFKRRGIGADPSVPGRTAPRFSPFYSVPKVPPNNDPSLEFRPDPFPLVSTITFSSFRVIQYPHLLFGSEKRKNLKELKLMLDRG